MFPFSYQFHRNLSSAGSVMMVLCANAYFCILNAVQSETVWYTVWSLCVLLLKNTRHHCAFSRSIFFHLFSLFLCVCLQLSGGCELTVVLQDHVASCVSELSVQTGQTVELLERPSERPGWCLVRTTDKSPPQEGLVPSTTLCISHSRSSVEMDCFFPSGKGTDTSGVFFLFVFFLTWPNTIIQLNYSCYL